MDVTSAKQEKFLNRFKGKIGVMDKDGHLGVVASSNKPIQKMGEPVPIQQSSQNYKGGHNFQNSTPFNMSKLRFNHKDLTNCFFPTF